MASSSSDALDEAPTVSQGCKRKVLLAAVFGILPQMSAAEDAPVPVVEIGPHTFLVGEVPRATLREDGFLPFNDVDWVHEIMDADPVMGPLRIVFFVDERNSVPQLLEQGWVEDHYGSQDLVPEAFRIEGLRVEVSAGDPPPFTSYLLLEEGRRPNWVAQCTYRYPPDERSEFMVCTMGVNYRNSVNFKASARIYAPPYLADIGDIFPALADRMVEILTCLDVTDDIPATAAEGHARLARLRAENPELWDCELALPS